MWHKSNAGKRARTQDQGSSLGNLAPESFIDPLWREVGWAVSRGSKRWRKLRGISCLRHPCEPRNGGFLFQILSCTRTCDRHSVILPRMHGRRKTATRPCPLPPLRPLNTCALSMESKIVPRQIMIDKWFVNSSDSFVPGKSQSWTSHETLNLKIVCLTISSWRDFKHFL